jgi:hypothetical protein
MIFKEGTVVEGTINGEKVIGAVVSAKELPLEKDKAEIFKVIFQNDMTSTAVYGSAMAGWNLANKPERCTHLIVGSGPHEVNPL